MANINNVSEQNANPNIKMLPADTAMPVIKAVLFDMDGVLVDTERLMPRAAAEAFGDMGIRDQIYIATKTASSTPEEFWKDLETSLNNMKTDYIDIYQFHNPPVVYKPGDGTGMYECMLEAKAQGKIRHIGYTSHSIDNARECVACGLYETLQFPFSYISGRAEEEQWRAAQRQMLALLP